MLTHLSPSLVRRLSIEKTIKTDLKDFEVVVEKGKCFYGKGQIAETRMFLFLEFEFTDGQFQREEFKVKILLLGFLTMSVHVSLNFTHNILKYLLSLYP